MRTSATTVGAALAALVACAAWPLALEAQEPAEQQPAVGGAPEVSPLSNLRRVRDVFIDARDFSAALTPAQSVVDAQREQQRAAVRGGPCSSRPHPRRAPQHGGSARSSRRRNRSRRNRRRLVHTDTGRVLPRARTSVYQGRAVPGSDRKPRAGSAHQSAQPRLVQCRASAAARRPHDRVSRPRQDGRGAGHTDRAARQRDPPVRDRRSTRDPVSLYARAVLRAVAAS